MPKVQNRQNAYEDLYNLYTCPMHPDIRRNKSGNCPICGMPLEALLATEPPKALHDLKIKFVVSFIIAILYALGINGFFLHIQIFAQSTWNWIGLVITSIFFFWPGSMFFTLGYNSIKSRSLNMYTLISLGLLIASIYSDIVTIYPSFLNPIFLNGNGAYTYYDGFMFVLAFVILGEILQMQASYKTGSVVQEMLKLIPKTAYKLILKNGKLQEEQIDSISIQAKDHLRIKPGNKVPVDGIIIQGHSSIDTSNITGESLPVVVKKGSKIIGGTINMQGTFDMEANGSVNESTLYSIVQQTAQSSRTLSPIQKLTDDIVKWFVPIVISIAIITLIIWTIIGNPVFGIVSAISVIIIACPCALGLASPMSVMVGIGRAASKGIIISNASVISTANTIRTLVMDKTGTLTEGKPEIMHIHSQNKAYSKHDFLQIVASLESFSESPMASVITTFAKQEDISLLPVQEFHYEVGQGVLGKIQDKNNTNQSILWFAGNKKLFDSHKISIEKSLHDQHNEWSSLGQTVFYVGNQDKVLGLISLMDPIKKSAKDAIASLHQQNIRVIMATGDHHDTASYVAKALNIDEFYANMSPQDKNDLIQSLEKKGAHVAMAGDGVNDVLALSSASIGIAMGNGTDVAQQSGNVTLVKGSLEGILNLFVICKRIIKNIWSNLFLSFLYNTLAIIIATGVFYTIFGWVLNPAIAGLAMSLSSFSVIMNSSRLRWM